jgi:hypothetical protein
MIFLLQLTKELSRLGREHARIRINNKELFYELSELIVQSILATMNYFATNTVVRAWMKVFHFVIEHMTLHRYHFYRVKEDGLTSIVEENDTNDTKDIEDFGDTGEPSDDCKDRATSPVSTVVAE